MKPNTILKDAPKSVRDIRAAAELQASVILSCEEQLFAEEIAIICFEAGVQYILAKFLALQNAGSVAIVKDDGDLHP